jgi:penicillin-binding protein 2
MRNSPGSRSDTPVRVAQIASIAILILLGIFLFRLQIVKGDHYSQLSENNYIVEASITAPRGLITDRNGNVIAGRRQSFSICAIPRSILRNQDEILTLGKVLDVDVDFIREKLEKTASSYRPTAIVRDVDFATLSGVEEMFTDLPDVIVISEPVRFYPRGEYFGHMVGYVGEVTPDEIAANRGRYAPGDFIGKAGIEKAYEGYLRGRDGQKFVKFTPHGGASPVDLEDLPVRSPRPGMTVVLSADDDLQRLARDLLAGRRGCVIAADTRTGGILALVSSPAFDPNLFATGISSEDWDTIIKAEGKPLLNRAIQSSYPPGSTYKIITSAAALEEGKVSRNTRFRSCGGAYRFGNRVFSCWKKEGHGVKNLMDAIGVSCDVYFYQLGERLDLDRLSARSKGWFLDRRTGIDLPGEVTGLIPDPSYYDKTYGVRQWTKGVMLNLAIGQGELLLTPVELICFICGVANGGTYLTPHCVDRIESDVRSESVIGEAVDLAISQSTMEVLRKSMLKVVEGSDGTGRAARVPGIEVAGKTGTAQNPHGDDHASFVCFAPYEDPEIVIMVLVENGGHGGAVAAPIAGQLLAHYFGVSPADEVALTR